MLLTLVAFVFMLGVLIFVHELGHYMMAKRIGIRVLTFSLGFGPRIVGFKRGDTEYCVSAIPLGGYVKMAGETPEDTLSGRPDEFLSRSKWERFQVLIMGPVMNIVLAVVLTTAVYIYGADVPAFQDEKPVVGAVAVGSPAERAGIRAGDLIENVAGHAVSTWDDLFTQVGSRPNQTLDITVMREGRPLPPIPVKTTSETKFNVGDIGVMPDVHPYVADVTANSPAERAGFKRNDVVLAVDGETMVYQRQLVAAISKHPGTPITVIVLRSRQHVELHPTPGTKDGKIGILTGDAYKTIQPGVLGAMRLSVEKNYRDTGLIYQTVIGLLTRETSTSQLMGPVAIAQLSGRSAADGWVPYFLLMAAISLNLGLLNLLPIPVLDGGHIFIMGIEGLARRDFSMKVKEKMLLAGFVVLMMLMVTVIYNDLTRISWVERLMFWR